MFECHVCTSASPPDDVVNGKDMGTCLGDLYSVNWMEDVDRNGHLGSWGLWLILGWMILVIS